MITITFNTWELIQCSNMLASQSGNKEHLRKIFRLQDLLELSEEDKKEIEFEENKVETPDGKIALTYKWNQDADFIIDFEDADWDVFVSIVNSYTDWKPVKQLEVLFDKIDKAKEDAKNNKAETRKAKRAASHPSPKKK